MKTREPKNHRAMDTGRCLLAGTACAGDGVQGWTSACSRCVRAPGLPNSTSALNQSRNQGRVGGEAEDGPRPFEQGAQASRPVVPTPSAPPDRGSAANARAEAARALRVLRDHRELRSAQTLPRTGRARLAQVARPPLAAGTHDVGPHEATAGAQPAPAGTHPAALFPRVANPCPEEPDAGILHVRIRGGRGRATSRGYPSKRQLRILKVTELSPVARRGNTLRACFSVAGAHT